MARNFHLATVIGSPQVDILSEDSPAIATIGVTSTDDATTNVLSSKRGVPTTSSATVVGNPSQKKQEASYSLHQNINSELKGIHAHLKAIELQIPSINLIATCIEDLLEEHKDRSPGGVDLSGPGEQSPGILLPTDKSISTNNNTTKHVTFCTRRTSVDSTTTLVDDDDASDRDIHEICALMSWQRAPRPKPKPSPPTSLSQDDRLKLVTMETIEQMREFLASKGKPPRQRRYLNDEEKMMSFDELDNQWRQEDFERRQKNSINDLGYPTEDELKLSVPELRRLIREKKTQKFFERKVAEGETVNQCEVCTERYLGNAKNHRCVSTGWKLVDHDSPKAEQFIVTQRGSGDVRVRKMVDTDPELAKARIEKLSDQLGKHQKKAQWLANNVPEEQVPRIPDTPTTTEAKAEKEDPKESRRDEGQTIVIDLAGDNDMEMSTTPQVIMFDSPTP